MPIQVTVINKAAAPCRGVAYSTRNASHLLNVVARNMSALADQPNHFVDWLGTRCEYLDEPVAALREKFIPRRVYGDYIHSLFQWYSGELAGVKNTRLEFVRDEAEDISVEDGRAAITLAGGRTIEADKVVLAVGNQSPAPFRLRGLNLESQRYIGNPWIGWEEKLPDKDKDLLLIGTGLTMVDTFLSVRDLEWRGKLFAVSRNGLMPLSHFKGFDYPDYLDEKTQPIALRKAFSIFKQHYRATRERSLNPAILVDKLRPVTQRIWQGFSSFEKQQFNRHFRTRWNVTRHRIAPEIHQQLRDAIENGRLEVIKGRLLECVEAADKMTVWVQGSQGKRAIDAAAVINCTGPKESYVPTESTLFKNLFFHGLISPDAMNMGINVAPNFAVVDREGNSSDVLFALGSLLRGTLWESTAVPELRSQTFRLAETIAAQLARSAEEKSPISEVMQDVVEYSI